MNEIDKEIQIRQAARNVFASGDGPVMLTWILDECGLYEKDPVMVRPELVAFANRLLAMMGVVHCLNLVRVTEALLGAANDDDLHAKRQEAAREGE